MVDVRYGPDPLAAMLDPWTPSNPNGQVVSAGDDPHRGVPRRGISAGAVVLVLDSGQVHWFVGECMIGRSPVSASGADTLSLPDIGRRLSPNHVQLADVRDGGGPQVWATDQGSAAGTWLERPDGVVQLVPHVPTLLMLGDVVVVGDSRFRVERN